MAVKSLLVICLLLVGWRSPAQADVPFPPPLTVDDSVVADRDLVLAGPDTRSVIIVGTPPAYTYPYWGGDKILQRYLNVVTGVQVPIVRHDDVDLDAYDVRIWFGDQPRVREAIGALLEPLDEDGFVALARGTDIYLSGKTYRAGHYLPYDLLERAAGCRWFMMPPRFWMPKEDGMVGLGDVIPKLTRVVVPDNLLIVEEPSYRNRWFRIVPQHSYRMSYRDRFHHALVQLFPPDEMGATHPEYFPLIDGRRHLPPADRAYDFQPCISNPATVDVVVAAASAYFEAGNSTFSVGMNDSGRFCQCEACQALAPPTITDANARTAYGFFVWYNRIAERLYPQYPDKRLGCLAYATLSALPAGSIRLHKMVVPYLTRDSAQLFDPAEVQEFRETVDKWSGLSQRMGIYEYLYGQGFYIPRLYNRYLLANVKARYGVECDGFYGEAYPQWPLDAPKYWFVSKLLWNHRYRLDDLYRDYYEKMFGPAAGEMRAYFEFLEAQWCGQTLVSQRSNYRWMNDARQFEIFPPAVCRSAVAYLDAAAAAADSADIAKRIAYFRAGFEVTTALSTRYHSAQTLAAELAAETINWPAALTAFCDWYRLGSTEALYEQRAAAGLDLTRPVEYGSFRYQWDNSPAPYQLLHRLTREPVADLPEALAPLLDGLSQRANLTVRTVPQLPQIDGQLATGEWPQSPAWSGKFYEAFDLWRQSEWETTVYIVAGSDGEICFGFDCQGDPELIGATLTQAETEAQRHPREMLADDALVINVKFPGTHFTTFRVNVAGVGLVSPPSYPFTAAVSRTARGWQAELRIRDSRLTAVPAAAALNVAVSRYERRAQAGSDTAACTTLLPVGRFGGVIGHGNHPSLMAFVSGSRLIHVDHSTEEAQP